MDKLPESTNVSIVEAIPADILAHAAKIGRVEWGQTHAHDPEGHGAHVAESVRRTAARFQQTGDLHMHGLWLEGTQTVLCHTGTSPNAPMTTQALVGLWNWLVDLAFASKPTLTREASRWSERWYGSEPERGSAIVDERGNLIVHIGGDEATHHITTTIVAAHNAALDALPADVRRLVIAARAFIDPETVALPFMEEHAELFAAAEAFADRVPWLDQPDDVEDAA